MNPAWIGPIFVALGFVGNAAWGIYNMGQRAAIARQEAAIVGIKEWALREFVLKRQS
jgi:hypothetical protein